MALQKQRQFRLAVKSAAMDLLRGHAEAFLALVQAADFEGKESLLSVQAQRLADLVRGTTTGSAADLTNLRNYLVSAACDQSYLQHVYQALDSRVAAVKNQEVGRRPLQDFDLNLELYLPSQLWDTLLNFALPRTTRLSELVGHVLSLGCRCPSANTLAKLCVLTSLDDASLVCQAEPALQWLWCVRDHFKQAVAKVGRVHVLPSSYLLNLPGQPGLLPGDLYLHVFKNGKPEPSRADPAELLRRRTLWPLRRSNSAYVAAQDLKTSLTGNHAALARLLSGATSTRAAAPLLKALGLAEEAPLPGFQLLRDPQQRSLKTPCLGDSQETSASEGAAQAAPAQLALTLPASASLPPSQGLPPPAQLAETPSAHLPSEPLELVPAKQSCQGKSFQAVVDSLKGCTAKTPPATVPTAEVVPPAETPKQVSSEGVLFRVKGKQAQSNHKKRAADLDLVSEATVPSSKLCPPRATQQTPTAESKNKKKEVKKLTPAAESKNKKEVKKVATATKSSAKEESSQVPVKYLKCVVRRLHLTCATEKSYVQGCGEDGRKRLLVGVSSTQSKQHQKICRSLFRKAEAFVKAKTTFDVLRAELLAFRAAELA